MFILDLAQIPFDKLAEIQQKVGMKVFHQTLRGAEKKKVATKGLARKSSQDRYDDDDSEEEDSEEDSEEEERRPKNKMDKLRDAMNKEKKERKVIEKRADKNRYGLKILRWIVHLLIGGAIIERTMAPNISAPCAMCHLGQWKLDPRSQLDGSVKSWRSPAL